MVDEVDNDTFAEVEAVQSSFKAKKAVTNAARGPLAELHRGAAAELGLQVWNTDGRKNLAGRERAHVRA